ncbi:bifunctional glycosyltransferase/class I SAM-dependent methyltransferase [Selenomonas sp. KH1T6]|uniref:bifunctional glycosyltransferase/class I SAM-dependent methyltransferase n=1 Tax=Selenomonas sp. KH1T6 TaxID=3158784 RepID=UPI0008A7CD6D|nr:Glycosyltransferase, GT2 family [Selenomonas ruminantium]
MEKKLSIIISSLNDKQGLLRMFALLKDKVVYTLTPEFIVIDGGSTDGTQDVLKTAKGILWQSQTEGGLAKAFNTGAQLASGDYLLFLHSDTILLPGTISLLLKELEAAPEAVAIGPFTNRSRNRSVQVVQVLPPPPMDTYEDMCKFEEGWLTNHHNSASSLWLDNFCLLVRREAFEKVGGFDASFPGHGSEDIDLCLRLRQAGYRLLASRLAYAHHARTSAPLQNAGEDSKEHFRAKWHFDPSYSLNARNDLIPWLDDLQGKVSILEIGCACGPTLLSIKDRLPEAELYGVELDEGPAKVASSFAHVEACDIEALTRPDWRERFDCIICGDVIEHLRRPEVALKNIHHYLKPGGLLLLSVPNIMHISIFDHLLHGRFPYADNGLLDRTHTHFFTNREICWLLQATGFSIEAEDSLDIPLTAREQDLLQKITPLLAEGVSPEELKIYQIHIKCKKTKS